MAYTLYDTYYIQRNCDYFLLHKVQHFKLLVMYLTTPIPPDITGVAFKVERGWGHSDNYG